MLIEQFKGGKLKKVCFILIIAILLQGCGKEVPVEAGSSVSADVPVSYGEQIPVIIDEGPINIINKPSEAPEKTPVKELPKKEMPLPSKTETVSDTAEDISPSSNDITEEVIEDAETVSENEVPSPSDIHSLQGVRVYIDPGHGGDAACLTEYDGKQYERPSSGGGTGDFPNNSLGTAAGTSGGGWSECDAVYQIALQMEKEFKETGATVSMSRDDVHTASDGGGTAIGNWERGRRAAAYDYWIVIHADGGGGKGIHCVSWQSDPLFRTFLCDSFLNAMAEAGCPLYTASGYSTGYSGNSSGTLQAPSEYVRNDGDPSRMLYIEAGFMDDPNDLGYMVSDKGRQEIASAAARAVIETERSGTNEQ